MTTKMKCAGIRKLEEYERFKKVCKFIVMEEEYPGWTGHEDYGIITDVTEEELLKLFPAVMKALRPYIILDTEFGKARNVFINNDRRYMRHKIKMESLFDADDDMECHHKDVAQPDFSDALNNRLIVEAAFSCLTRIQAIRVYKHFYYGMSSYQIASSEQGNVNPKTVRDSIEASLKKMKNSLS